MWYVTEFFTYSFKKCPYIISFSFSDKIPNCIENPANPLTCFYKDDLNGAGTFDEALTECNKMLGYLPRPVIKLQAEKLWETMGGGAPIWTGLVTEENPLVKHLHLVAL